MEEKAMKKRFNKEMNNEYVKIFKDKVDRDMAKERQEMDDLKRKQMDVQNHILQQIEEKRLRTKGMTNDEFEFNKDLLKEIATKRKDLKSTIMTTNNETVAKQNAAPLPAYEIYNL